MAAVAITFASSNSNTSAASSYTFTAQSIGTASSDRVVIVAAWIRNDNSYTPSLTIGGVSATLLTSVRNGSPGGVALFALNVTSGTTANIVLNLTTSANRVAIAVWAMTGTNGSTTTSATASASSGSPTISTTINVPQFGGGVAASADFNGISNTSTWSGFTTKDVDIQPGTNAFSAAHATFSTAQVGLTVSDTFSGTTTSPALAVVSFASAPVSAVGSASGAATVSGTTTATAASTAAASGTGTAAGIGAATAEAVAAAAGTSTEAAVGTGVIGSPGSSTGVATVAGVGTGINAAVASSSGIATVTGVAIILPFTSTIALQKPVDYALAGDQREYRRGRAHAGALKGIFRE